MDDLNLINKKESLEPQTTQEALQSLGQHITFFIADRLFSIDVMVVQDIILAPDVFRIPNTHAALLGVINLRGEILPVYSLKLILGLDDEIAQLNTIPADDNHYVVIVSTEGYTLGLYIDEIYHNITLTRENYSEGNQLQLWTSLALFSGVILHENAEILCIDTKNLLEYMVRFNYNYQKKDKA